MHDVPKLAWNEEIAKFSQNWCDRIRDNKRFEHSLERGYGENIGYLNTESQEDREAAAGKIVTTWYDEISLYDYTAPGSSARTLHFTQIVWKTSTQLGCGISFGTKGIHNYKVTWVCCNYSPAGNFNNQYEENVPRPLK